MKPHTSLFSPDETPTSGGGTLLSGGGEPAAPADGSTPPAAPSADSGWVDATGKFNAGWMDRLPPELKGNASLATVPDLPTLAQNYLHTKGLVGKRLEIPGPDAPPEQLAEWREKLGVPKTADDYGSLRPESIPETAWDPTVEKQIQSLAHKHNIPPAALKELVGVHAEMVQKGEAQLATEMQTWTEGQSKELKQAWGAKFDEHLNQASNFAKMIGVDLDDPTIGNNAKIIQALQRGAALLGGDKLVTGTSPTGSASIEARIASIQDLQSQDLLARQYRGEFGADAQSTAAATLRQLMQARAQAKGGPA